MRGSINGFRNEAEFDGRIYTQALRVNSFLYLANLNSHKCATQMLVQGTRETEIPAGGPSGNSSRNDCSRRFYFYSYIKIAFTVTKIA